MTDVIVVDEVTRTRTPDGVRYECRVSGLGPSHPLRFDVIAASHTPARSDDWVLLSLLMPAMQTGRDLRIDGRISPLLLYAARTDLQFALRRYDPSLSLVRIDADLCLDPAPPRNGVRIGTGFSAGIDSFAAIGSFEAAGLVPALAVTDVFTFNVGAIGVGRSPHVMRAFRLMLARLDEFAALTGRTAHAVDSNLQLFYTPLGNLDFVRTHTMRNMAAASLFQSEIDHYLYASAYSYDEITIDSAATMANFDPILLPLIAPEGMRFHSANAGMNRIEKTRVVARDEIAQRMLDVCVAPAARRAEAISQRRNCSRCWKCYRTMVTLDALGELGSFARVFDVDHYHERTADILTAVKKKGTKGSVPDRAAYDCYVLAKSAAASGLSVVQAVGGPGGGPDRPALTD